MATVLDKIRPITGNKKPPAGTVQWFLDNVARGGIHTEAVVVTPGLAKVLLERNSGNRNVRPIKVTQFATDMKAGRWAFNGEPVIVSSDGQINDGQHRLTAIIEANTPVELLFVFGVARETRLTVDQGASRTASDYLGMEGVENSAACATIARLVIAIERENGVRLYRENEVTNAEIRARVNADHQIAEAAHYAMSVYRYTKSFAAPGIIGTAFYLLNEVNPIEARDYMDRVAIGEGLRRTDPAYAVRDALLSLGKGQRGGKIEAIFRGWVKFRLNQPLKIAKVLGTFPALV